MSLLPRYTHIVNPKLKHIYLSFDDVGNLVIKSPKVSQKQIEQLLLKKSSWITKARSKFASKKGKSISFTKDSELYFLGESHHLKLIYYDKKRTKLIFDGDLFTLYYSKYDEGIFQKHIDNFYKEEAKLYIPSLVTKWGQTMHLQHHDIRFRKTKRQWGSCSSKNDLCFNTMMMKLPLDVIQYIVVHELAHIKHKHHQKAFWQFVEQYLPSYKLQVKELKNFTT
jgi:predicted metal-dependent hydrolase